MKIKNFKKTLADAVLVDSLVDKSKGFALMEEFLNEFHLAMKQDPYESGQAKIRKKYARHLYNVLMSVARDGYNLAIERGSE